MQIDLELLLNLPNIRITDYTLSDTEAHIHCESTESHVPCPLCGRLTPSVRMYQDRLIRDMPLLGRKVYLHVRTRQFHCLDCERYFKEQFSFVVKNKTLSKRYESYLYKLSTNICISQVSIKEDIAWTTIQSIHKRYSSMELRNRSKLWRNVTRIGIDEISIHKGMKNYACNLVDLDTGRVLDFLENRRKETLVSYFSAKGSEFCKQIKVVSSDMWDAYSSLAGTLFPNAIAVIDRYHFFLHINKALDATRKLLRKSLPDEPKFKHLRWVLLKNPKHLSLKEQELLDAAFSASPMMAQVYKLRQELKSIFDADLTKAEASLRLAQWEEKLGRLAASRWKLS